MSQSHESELLRTARAVARLQTQCRKLRRQLKQAQADLRAERKNLKALAGVQHDREPDNVPSRTFGPGVGHKIRGADHTRPEPSAVDTTEVVEQLIGFFEPEKEDT